MDLYIIKMQFNDKEELFKILTQMVDDEKIAKYAGILINNCRNSLGCYIKISGSKCSLLLLNERQLYRQNN